MAKKNTKKDEIVVENTEVVEVVEGVEAVEAVEAKVEVPKIDIIRGRMPLPIVAMIKFGTDGETDGAVATKFRTTNGKVSDIRKDRNFGYITAAYVPNADMIAKALVYAEQLNAPDIVERVKALKAGTDEDDAKLAERRKASRPEKKDKDKDPEAAPVEVSDDELNELVETPNDVEVPTDENLDELIK
jgi:hypothetical protein